MSELSHDKRSHFWLLNNETGEVYPLGPMYGRDSELAARKLEREDLQFSWTLLAPVSAGDGQADGPTPGEDAAR